MKNTPKNRIDPFIAATDVLSDAWTLLVIQEFFFGARRFGEFVEALEIPRARLSERLRHLGEEGLIDRRPRGKSASRREYRLTEKGRAVYPVALALLAWSETWRGGRTRRTLDLVHTRCGKRLAIDFRCRGCSDEVSHDDLRWPRVASLDQVSLGTSSVRRWRQGSQVGMAAIRGDPVIEALRVVGDRWSMLIMYGAQITDFRFTEAEVKLGIATNILAQRLEHLTDHGVLERVAVEGGHRYRATDSGLALLDAVIAARTWALDWIPKNGSEWTKLLHAPCGKDLRVDCRCGSCGCIVTPQDVSGPRNTEGDTGTAGR